jgi:NADH-quinone oxidoreductase subunit M
MMQQAFQGTPDEQRSMPDFNAREMFAMAAMMVALLWLGLYPQPVLDLAQPVIESVQELAPGANAAAALVPGAVESSS